MLKKNIYQFTMKPKGFKLVENRISGFPGSDSFSQFTKQNIS